MAITPNQPPRGEYPANLKPKSAENIKNIAQTEAGQKAIELDEADGQFDGRISASVWNAYADEHGGTHVQNGIGLADAMNSITTYSVREAQEKAQAEKAELQAGEQEKPEMGL